MGAKSTPLPTTICRIITPPPAPPPATHTFVDMHFSFRKNLTPDHNAYPGTVKAIRRGVGGQRVNLLTSGVGRLGHTIILEEKIVPVQQTTPDGDQRVKESVSACSPRENLLDCFGARAIIASLYKRGAPFFIDGWSLTPAEGEKPSGKLPNTAD